MTGDAQQAVSNSLLLGVVKHGAHVATLAHTSGEQVGEGGADVVERGAFNYCMQLVINGRSGAARAVAVSGVTAWGRRGALGVCS